MPQHSFLWAWTALHSGLRVRHADMQPGIYIYVNEYKILMIHLTIDPRFENVGRYVSCSERPTKLDWQDMKRTDWTLHND